MKKFFYVLAAIPLIVVAAALHYALPQVDVVRIIDTDVKRVDLTSTEDTTTSTKDVYFIHTENLNGKPVNYRNEDNLFYAKFDSSNLHTRAKSISQSENNLVAMRHYGWRIPFLSMFPNAVKTWQVEPDYRHLPLFNIIFLTLLASAIGYVTWKIRRGRRL